LARSGKDHMAFFLSRLSVVAKCQPLIPQNEHWVSGQEQSPSQGIFRSCRNEQEVGVADYYLCIRAFIVHEPGQQQRVKCVAGTNEDDLNALSPEFFRNGADRGALRDRSVRFRENGNAVFTVARILE